MGPKIFTANEAGALIPNLDGIFKELDTIRASIKQIKSKMDTLEMLWGETVNSEDNPDRREYLHYLQEIDKLKKQFDAAINKFVDLECFFKGLDSGLIDFYGVIDGRLVYICWQRGEKEIGYWHHLEDGFAGRQPLPEKKNVV